MNALEAYTNNKLKNIWQKYSSYSEMQVFAFLPGHRRTLTRLGKQAEEYITSKKSTSGLNPTQCTIIMNELINSMESNANRPPRARRYSEIILWFSIYIYILAGKASYEILSNNLYLPDVTTIGKIMKSKQIPSVSKESY